MPENKKKTRGNLAVMGRLVGLVKPLAPVMLAAVLLGVAGFLCAIFITVLGAYALLDSIQLQTGLDVAASTNPTGSTALGGDWDLEVVRGELRELRSQSERDSGQSEQMTLELRAAREERERSSNPIKRAWNNIFGQ